MQMLIKTPKIERNFCNAYLTTKTNLNLKHVTKQKKLIYLITIHIKCKQKILLSFIKNSNLDPTNHQNN